MACCVCDVGMNHESPRNASASRGRTSQPRHSVGGSFVRLLSNPRALRHDNNTPWDLSAPVQLKFPACRDFCAPHASFAPAHGRPLRVCGSTGLSYTQIHRQPRLPRHPAAAQHSAKGGWACVSECVLLRYDVIVSSPSAGLCAGVLVVTGGARICAEHTDANFGSRARATPLPHGAQPPLQRI